jgi:ketosteroid isomerase-like protein
MLPMMSTAQNKQLMEEIFNELSKGNSKPFGEAMADDFCWTIGARRRRSPRPEIKGPGAALGCLPRA